MTAPPAKAQTVDRNRMALPQRLYSIRPERMLSRHRSGARSNDIGVSSNRVSRVSFFFHAPKNVGGAIPRQDAFGIGLVPASELFDMRGDHLGALLFLAEFGEPDPLHLDRRAVRLKLKLVLSVVPVDGGARERGHPLRGEASNLPADAAGGLDRGRRQAIDLGSVL